MQNGESGMSSDHSSNLLPCPFCGGNQLDHNSWHLDDEEVDAIECRECKAGAPLASWNKRPDPWRYPPDMPEVGQRIVMTYRQSLGGESREMCTTCSATDWKHYQLAPMVRWMPVPEIGE